MQINQHIFQLQEMAAPEIPLHVHLVKGPEYAVLLDSGLAQSLPGVLALIGEAGLDSHDVRLLFNTHAHHDHIGSNSGVKAACGCLIGAHPGSVAWIEDHERNFQEFCCSYPAIFPDTPELRAEIVPTMDAPTRVDLRIREGFSLDLGDDIRLEAIEVPGHMQAELAFYEPKSRTLLLGDAVTGTDWFFFHGHLNPAAYRQSVEKLRRLTSELPIDLVLAAHFPPMNPAQFQAKLNRVDQYLGSIDDELLKIVREVKEPVSLENSWRELCRRMHKKEEFRGLSMVAAHLQKLVQEREIVQVGPNLYNWS